MGGWVGGSLPSYKEDRDGLSLDGVADERLVVSELFVACVVGDSEHGPFRGDEEEVDCGEVGGWVGG